MSSGAICEADLAVGIIAPDVETAGIFIEDDRLEGEGDSLRGVAGPAKSFVSCPKGVYKELTAELNALLNYTYGAPHQRNGCTTGCAHLLQKTRRLSWFSSF